ncbi:DsbA family protein [Mycobacterium sp.]|uniref:mycothiol-dependent nitroreductase Rv2466c family protein n=2 Tax=Mycobacterium sp. TaxID=1785 RepID=UPI0031E08344
MQEYPPRVVRLWLDPVCPFSWNTARWLTAAAEADDFTIDWHMMSLAVLNEGRELPPPQQARMQDSRKIGRLMAALHEELGADVLSTAYMAFAQRYFDDSADVDDELVDHVTRAVGAQRTGASALDDHTLDATVVQFHQASQDALGDTGGSPLLTIDGHTVFGPVFTAVPDPEETPAVFRAVAALMRTPQFSQLHRPRGHA